MKIGNIERVIKGHENLVSTDLLKKLDALGNVTGTNQFIIMYSAYHILINKYREHKQDNTFFRKNLRFKDLLNEMKQKLSNRSLQMQRPEYSLSSREIKLPEIKVTRLNKTLKLNWLFPENIKNPMIINRIMKQFIFMLEEIVENPCRKIWDLSMLIDAPRKINVHIPFTCYIIGEGTLPIWCGKLLLKQNHTIHGIISADRDVIQWAEEKQIPIKIPKKPSIDIPAFLKQKPFDYLFSVVNPYVLKGDVLNLPRFGSINYHDSPLPQYAGIHATSWALMNCEKSHAISWHIVEEGLDTGYLLKQVPVHIEEKETALSLNSKCYEAAGNIFKTLISELSANNISGKKQDYNNRSYYGLYERPEAGCVLSWNFTAEKIDAMTRALNFGGYPNPLGTAKILVGNEYIVVKEVELLNTFSISPGVIKELNKEYVIISTASQDIKIRKLYNINGQKLLIEDAISRWNWHKMYKFKNLTRHEKKHLTRLYHETCKNEKFWINRLKSLNPISIPYANKLKKNTLENYKKLRMDIPEEVVNFLTENKTIVNKANFWYAASTAYLSRLCGVSSFDCGYRWISLPCLLEEKGFFASYVPFRIKVEKDECFETYLKYIKKELDLLERRKTYARDINIRYTDIEVDHRLTVSIEIIDSFKNCETKPVISLNIIINRMQNQIYWVYDEQIYHSNDITKMHKQFSVLLKALTHESTHHLPVNKLPILPDEEKQLILSNFNNTHAFFSENKLLSQFFEERVEKIPGKTALVFNNKRLTYREVNNRANQLAVFLRKNGVKQNTIVAIMLHRSFDMIISILGIIKAGGAYLPVNPDNPLERIKYILEDSKASFVLTSKNQSSRITGICEIIEVDDPPIYDQNTDNLTPVNTSRDLAYIIYTSGSTGNPKGVMIEHRSAVNILSALEKKYPVHEEDSYLLKTTYTFDVSVAELFGWFIGRGKLVILEPGYEKEPRKIIEIIAKENITHINFVPSMFKLFLFVLKKEEMDSLKSLKHIFVAGEVITPDIVKNFYKLDTGIEFENIYGPTESTIYATSYSLKNLTGENNVPIGKPVQNIECYIVDDKDILVPVGVAGELCLGGKGLARGYLNRPELTKEKFPDNPFRSGEKMYRTGDLARWLPGGNIEYLGRIDFQIKIRGFRVELGEIETAIRDYPGVKDIVVASNKSSSGDVSLAAYIVEEENNGIDYTRLKKKLKAKLPGYMVPNFFAILDQIPLNQNGKVNRKALKKIELITVQEETFVKPTNSGEQKIAEVWEEILHLDNIGINDNFLEAGGDSLKYIELNAKLNKIYNKEISVIKMFEYPTIKKQVECYTGNGKPNLFIKPGEKKEEQTPVKSTDIAIIGMAGRFPGAPDIEQFWENLVTGKETITFFNDDELTESGIDPNEYNKPNYVKAKGILTNVEYFDADFFGYSKREARFMDPQLRIFHEVVYKALEKSGYSPNTYDGKIGLFAGATNNYYWLKYTLMNKKSFSEIFPMMILNKDYLSTRVAYKLNLRGPVYNVQTACSTSLVAVDMAVESLLQNNCEIALAGGISLFLPEKEGYLYKEGFTFSPDGHCRAFDSRAKGMILGEGAGVVVLKAMEKAVEDGDTIWAVIKGSATNNDGTDKIGYTAPSINGQAEVINKAIERACIPPETISYVEAHGTGTSLGDPIEIAGLTKAFDTKKKQFCYIGSVKTNIGHLDTAAGIAGLIKTALSLYYKKIPPILNYDKPNPKINFLQTPFIVNTTLTEWRRSGNTPLRAGVSSFGIGGTNAHVVLEEAPEIAAGDVNNQARNQFKLILFSAKTEEALSKITENLYEYLKHHPEVNINDVAYTLQVGKESFHYRKMLICKNIEELIKLLSQDAANPIIYTQKTINDQEEIIQLEQEAQQLLEDYKNRETVDYMMLYRLGRLWCKGASIHWDDYYINEKRKRIILPSYPFERKWFWIDEIKKNIQGSNAVKNDINQNCMLKTSNLKSKQDVTVKLQEIWQKFLEVDQVGIEEDYFDLGGDSLLAIQIIPEINKEFNTNLSPNNAFLNHSTIEEQSDDIWKTIQSSNNAKTSLNKNKPNLIILKKGDEKNTPLFLIHPVAGTVSFYRELTKALSGDQNIYGIEALGVDGNHPPIGTIEEMAEKYIDAIRQIQPEGPYYIGGSSLGGCIAYEMAAQLEKRDESIKTLFMIDTPGPKTPLPGFKDDVEVLAYYLSYNNFNFTESVNHLKKLSERERLVYFLNQNSVYKDTLFDDNSIEKLKTSILLTLHNLKAMENYNKEISKNVSGRIIFFSATEASRIPVNLENDWKNFYSGEFFIHHIEGNHITINLSPNVNAVAGIIDKYMYQQ